MNISPVGGTPGQESGSYVSGASMSFTNAPLESWSQSLTSPIGQRFLQAISQTTGLSVSDVTSQLQSGSTLRDILSSKGVTFQQVRRAVNSQGEVSHHRHGHHAAMPSAFVETLAGKMGMTSSQLLQDLQSGTGIEQIATQQGMSTDQLASAIQDAVRSTVGYGGSLTSSTTGQIDATA